MGECQEMANLAVEGMVASAWKKGLADPKKSVPARTIARGSEKRNYVGMSQAGSCGRAVTLGLLAPEASSPLSMQSMLTFHDGDLLEVDTVAILSVGGLEIDGRGREMSRICSEETQVKGHIDGQFFWELNRQLYLFEHKTMRGFPFQKLIGKKRGDPNPQNVQSMEDGVYILEPGTVESAYPNYAHQVQCYMQGDDYTGCAFFVRCKDEASIAIEMIEKNVDVADDMLDSLWALADNVDNGMIAPRDYDPHKDWKCDAKYCRYREACLKIGKGQEMGDGTFAAIPADMARKDYNGD